MCIVFVLRVEIAPANKCLRICHFNDPADEKALATQFL